MMCKTGQLSQDLEPISPFLSGLQPDARCHPNTLGSMAVKPQGCLGHQGTAAHLCSSLSRGRATGGWPRPPGKTTSFISLEISGAYRVCLHFLLFLLPVHSHVVACVAKLTKEDAVGQSGHLSLEGKVRKPQHMTHLLL